MKDNFKKFIRQKRSGGSVLFFGANPEAVSEQITQEIADLLQEEGSENAHIKIKNNSHPDFLLINENPILVDNVREGLGFLKLTAIESPYKILLFANADSMNVNASNALLKSLEEPQQGCFIILISSNVGKLLPTIRSRCYKIPVTVEMTNEDEMLLGYAKNLLHSDLSFDLIQKIVAYCKDDIKKNRKFLTYTYDLTTEYCAKTSQLKGYSAVRQRHCDNIVKWINNYMKYHLDFTQILSILNYNMKLCKDLSND